MIIVSIVLFGLLLFWVGNIKTIIVSGDFTKEPLLQAKTQACLEKYKERSFWFLSDKTIEKSVLECDKMILSARISNKIPGSLVVTLTLLQPQIKVSIGEGQCLLIQDSAHQVDTTSERCLLYNVPELLSKQQTLSSFVFDYATTLVSLSRAEGITIQKIEYKGEQVAPWYAVTIEPNITVYLPASAVVKQKVAMLSASLKGLNDAKERYSVIDLRFDRVVYK